jgi:hypothetical protein
MRDAMLAIVACIGLLMIATGIVGIIAGIGELVYLKIKKAIK